MKLVPRTLWYLLPYWPLAAGSILVTVLSALGSVATPWPLAFVFDNVLGDYPRGWLGERKIGREWDIRPYCGGCHWNYRKLTFKRITAEPSSSGYEVTLGLARSRVREQTSWPPIPVFFVPAGPVEAGAPAPALFPINTEVRVARGALLGITLLHLMQALACLTGRPKRWSMPRRGGGAVVRGRGAVRMEGWHALHEWLLQVMAAACSPGPVRLRGGCRNGRPA